MGDLTDFWRDALKTVPHLAILGVVTLTMVFYFLSYIKEKDRLFYASIKEQIASRDEVDKESQAFQLQILARLEAMNTTMAVALSQSAQMMGRCIEALPNSSTESGNVK